LHNSRLIIQLSGLEIHFYSVIAIYQLMHQYSSIDRR